MSKKIIILILIIFSLIYFHHHNKYQIFQYSREIEQLSDQFKSVKSTNLSLLSENGKLCCRERIQKIASDKLKMFYPVDAKNVHTVIVNSKDETFRLVDYFVPSAEAITK